MESNKLYDSFCIEFPIETLNEMSLEKYTNLNKKDSFCYWLERITKEMTRIIFMIMNMLGWQNVEKAKIAAFNGMEYLKEQNRL